MRETDPCLWVDARETRLQGVTFADALNAYGQENKIDVSQIPLGDPQQFFGSVAIGKISADSTHALAVGRDEDRVFLIRDGESIHQAFGDFEYLGENEDFSQVVVKITYHDSQAMMLSEPEIGKEHHLASGISVYLLRNEDFNKFLVGEVHKGRTQIKRREVGQLPTVLGEVKKEMDDVSLKAASDDLNQVIWRGYESGKGIFLFRNSELLAKPKNSRWLISEDLQRVAVMESKGSRKRVLVNGQRVFEGKKGDFLTNAKGTPDLAVFAVGYSDQDGRRLLVWKADCPYSMHQYRIDDNGFNITPENDKLTIVFQRGNAKRKLEFGVVNSKSSKPTEVQVTETSGEGLGSTEASPA